MGRVYTGDEIDQQAGPPPLPEETPIDLGDAVILDEEIEWPDPGELDPAVDPSMFPPAGADEPPPP
jgi:hypothetical protein